MKKIVEGMRAPKKRYENGVITFPDDRIKVFVGQDSSVNVQLPSGKWLRLRYDATEEEVKRVVPTD